VRCTEEGKRPSKIVFLCTSGAHCSRSDALSPHRPWAVGCLRQRKNAVEQERKIEQQSARSCPTAPNLVRDVFPQVLQQVPLVTLTAGNDDPERRQAKLEAIGEAGPDRGQSPPLPPFQSPPASSCSTAAPRRRSTGELVDLQAQKRPDLGGLSRHLDLLCLAAPDGRGPGQRLMTKIRPGIL